MDINSILLSNSRSSPFSQAPMWQSNLGAVGTDSFRSKLAELTSNFTLSAGMDRSAIHAAVSNALAGENNIHGISSAGSRFVQPAMAHVVQSRVAEPFNIRDYYPPLTMREIRDKLLYAQWKFLGNTDFSGMSDIEIYDTIENWFIQEFGENFNKAYKLDYRTSEFLAHGSSATQQGIRDFFHIGSKFNWIVGGKLGGRIEMENVNSERLFGDKSDEEIKQTIMDRYPPPLTYRNLALMHGEMRAVGLFNREFGTNWLPQGTNGHGSTFLIGTIAGNYGREKWQASLNQPVNWQTVIDCQNLWLNLGDRVPSREFINLFEELIPRFANTSGQGNFDSWLSWVRTI
ncbi:MAG: hypothetical protein FWC13_04555 [Oscillospiraceae bacterium]|nr:hypothetical protein [Oscillospiraceae bacterium]